MKFKFNIIHKNLKDRKELLKHMGWPMVVLMMFLLPSCSEEIDFSGAVNEVPDGLLRISLAIPEPEIVSTRGGGDSDINTLDVFFFSENGNALYQHNQFTGLNGGTTVGINLSGGARDNQVLIYAVANAPECAGVSTVEALRKYLIDKEISMDAGSDFYVPMIGYRTVNTATNSSTTVSLYRSVAKISVSYSARDVSVEGFRIYHYAKKGYLGSPVNKEDEYKDFIIDAEENDMADKDSEGNDEVIDSNNVPEAYLYPSVSTSPADFNKGAFIVVKVNKNGKEEYYRINLRYEDEEGKLKYMDLLANHHYMIKITGFISDGYESYEEAKNHPDCDQYLTYVIHDHASKVLSMITDGYHELGVTPEITLNSSHESRSIIVKCFSPDATVSKEEISFDVPDWLEVDKGTEYSDDSFSQSWDVDNPGQQFEYTISMAPDARVYEDKTGEITVSWNGLTRTITVNFEASFNLDEVCGVTLSIYEDGDLNKKFSQIIDYFTFIRNNGKSPEKDGLELGENNIPRLFGNLPDNLVGAKRRTNGFHFPMPYGVNYKDHPWEYVYEIDFTRFLDLFDTGDAIENIEYEIVATGEDANIINKANIKWSYKGNNVGTLTFENLNTSYQYAEGKIFFYITHTDSKNGGAETVSEIETNIYHTGFFHYEGDTKYAPESALGYYYYEVVPMAGGYWLDRNIGATSNQPYIDIEDPNHTSGIEAAGRQFTIIDETQEYALPIWDFNMCPPGYHVPNATEWDEVRLHKNFKTETVTIDGTLYMQTYFVTEGGKIGNVFFQKSRFCNRKNIYSDQTKKYDISGDAGDAGAGYYWTITEAPAMEKEQMGNWLRALYLNGSSSTYNNASVTDHRMPVRCKSGNMDDAKDAEEYYISFNVHNATHVYLFDKDTKAPLYTFPGRAIGTYNSAEKWQHFSCSTTQPLDKLWMLFVNLQSDGKVYIYTKANETLVYNPEDLDNWRTFEAVIGYEKDYLTDKYAWNIKRGYYYDFCEDVGLKREHNPFSGIAEATDFGDYKECEKSDSGGGGGSGGGENMSGNVSWSNLDMELWWGGFDQLAYGRYDWSSVTKATLILTLNVYYYPDNNCIIRLCNGNWTGLNGAANDYHFSKNGPQTMTVELNAAMLSDIKSNNGLVIQGNNLQLKGVELNVE